ncbi:MAG: cytidylate kinase-like family protein [Lachnospiraceae bacterium]|nr:cytidylate kinase-like family protein [Lachnospiraceae bacterium]
MDKVIITIARQYGSGGKTVGQMLAKDMGINCYSREILRMASDESGIREEMFNKADEKLRTTPLFGASKKVYRGQLISPESDGFVSDDNLFNYQAKIIKELAEREPCVIVGRCADFVLKDREDVVSVFVHAPMDYCIARGMERNDMDEKEMEKFIQKTDKYRGDYYHYYTGHVWNDARNYDLCLNSSKLGFDKCVEAIKGYINVRFGG